MVDMTATDPKLEPLRAEIRELSEGIEEIKGILEGLYSRRRAVFRKLRDGGEAQAAIARLAGLSPMAVAFQLDKFERDKA